MHIGSEMRKNTGTVEKILMMEEDLEQVALDMANDSEMPTEMYVKKYSILDKCAGVQSHDPNARALFRFVKDALQGQRELLAQSKSEQLPRKQELTETQQVISFFMPEPKKELLDSFEQAEMQSECHRIQDEQEKAEFESDKRKLIDKRVKIQNDYSTLVSLTDYKKQHSSIMFMRFGNEELQNIVEECRKVYTKGLEAKEAKQAQRQNLIDITKQLGQTEIRPRKRSHEEVDGSASYTQDEVAEGTTVSKPKGQTANAEEAVHMLGVKQSEIRAIESYIEEMKDNFKHVDMSKVKPDKLVMNTHLETIFDPIKDGIEVCTMLRTQSQAKPMDWDHGHIPIEDLVIDDDGSMDSDSQAMQDMKSKYDLAKQQYSELSTRHTNVLNELDKVREGISLVKVKYRKEVDEAQKKYDTLARKIQFYAEGIERLGGSFQEESIKAGVYEEKIETMEYDLDQYESEMQQYIAEIEELNGEIDHLEDDLEKQGENYTDLIETNQKLWQGIADSDAKLQHEKAMNNGIVEELDFMRKQEEKMTALLNTQEDTIDKYKIMAYNTENLLDKTEMLKTQLEDQLTVSNNAISELLAEKGEVGEVMEKLFEHKNAEIADLQCDNNDLVCLLEEKKDAIAELERKEKSLQNSLDAVDKMLIMLGDTVVIGVDTNKKLLKDCEEREYDLGRAVSKLDKEQDTRIQLEERIKILEDCQRGLEEQLETVEDALEESGERYFNTVRIKAIECDDQAISDLGLYNEMLLERIQELEKQVDMRGDIPEDKEGAIKHLNNLKHELSVLTEKMLNTQIKISQIEKQEDMEEAREEPDGLAYRGSRIVQVDNVVLHTCIDNRHINEELDTHVHGVVGAVTTLVDIAGRSGAKGMASMILEFDTPESSNIPGMN